MHQTNGNGIVESLPSLARTVAVIPAYNEERFIGSVVIKACKYADAGCGGRWLQEPWPRSRGWPAQWWCSMRSS